MFKKSFKRSLDQKIIMLRIQNTGDECKTAKSALTVKAGFGSHELTLRVKPQAVNSHTLGKALCIDLPVAY